MKDNLKEQISEAKKQIKEAKMYAKYYQENFKEEAEQRIHDMGKEIEECKREKATELNDKKIELKRIEDEINAGNIKELLKKMNCSGKE